MEEIKLNWTLPEYEHREKTTDWFRALIIIIIAGSLTSIIYGNFFFAIILILGGGLMWYFGKKEPDMVSYELNEKGLMIKNRLFPYNTIKSFCVATEPKERLFIKSSRPFMPIITIPITKDLADKIKDIMLSKNVSEEAMKEHISEHIMDKLGF